MRVRRLALPALVAAATSCAPASYPDQPAVVAAEATWCQALGKVSEAGMGNGGMDTCKGAVPTGTAAVVKGMAKCLLARKEAGGDKPWDQGMMVAECKQEVFAKVNIDEAAAKETIQARCERVVRCEKTGFAECVAATKSIDPYQRAQLYGIYNGAALHEVASCLKSSSCGADE